MIVKMFGSASWFLGLILINTLGLVGSVNDLLMREDFVKGLESGLAHQICCYCLATSDIVYLRDYES